MSKKKSASLQGSTKSNSWQWKAVSPTFPGPFECAMLISGLWVHWKI